MEEPRREGSDARELNDILIKLEKLHHIRDLSTLLDSILFETRSLASADAGSIFLVEDGKLKFSYVQNDTLFRNDFLASKYIYANSEVPIDESSLAGYVATTASRSSSRTPTPSRETCHIPSTPTSTSCLPTRPSRC